jgi:hypothetical protein
VELRHLAGRGNDVGDRLRAALKNTSSDHWVHFERLASAFLSHEYGPLRTLASTSGDGGRDAILHQPESDPAYALQYSVTQDWQTKLRRTARQIANDHAGVTHVVYATPLELGAKADDLRKEIREKHRITIDVRDAHWFSERDALSAGNKKAADDYCRVVIDPLLERATSLVTTGSSLSNHESQAALIYLILQRQDDEQNRQLTKQCFDALTKAVLRATDNETRMGRSEIYSAVSEICPSHDLKEIQDYVDRALERMTKKAIRHWAKPDDSFCLAHDERVRIAEGMASLALKNERLDQEIEVHLRFVAEGLGEDLALANLPDVILRVRRVMERFLFERGEAFVESITKGEILAFVDAEIVEVARQDLLRHPDTSSLRHNMEQLLSESLQRLLVAPSDEAEEFLRAFADGYTLLAFLRETANVQSAVAKLFSHGEIWLDTSAVLPLLAEDLLDRSERGYSRIIGAAVEAGVRLYVTDGVLEEIGAHLDSCIQAWRSPDTWRSRTPFLLAAYIWSGSQPSGFPKWLETFRGRNRPEEDLVIYLKEELHIHHYGLDEFVQRSPEKVRWQAQEYWLEVHGQRRKKKGMEAPDPIIRQLAAHDTESFLGVIERRKAESPGNPFGYSSWWLTTDQYAPGAAANVSERSGVAIDSPVMSFDFLANYLVVGPLRRQLDKSRERHLPLALDTSLIDAPPKELLAAAAEARQLFHGQDERIIKRHIRDHLDREKLRVVKVGKTSMEALQEDIQMSLIRKGQSL